MGREKWKKIAVRVICAVLIVQSIFMNGLFSMPVHAENTTQQITNLVIFVRYADDTRDVFNSTYYEEYDTEHTRLRSNWTQLLQMYNQSDGTPDYSFKNFIYAVTEGKYSVNNYMPQQSADGTGVATMTLNKSYYADDTMIISEVINRMTTNSAETDKIYIDASLYKLDNLYAGVLDNLTIIVQGDGDTNDVIYPHKSNYAGSEKIAGSYVGTYNIIDSDSLVLEGKDCLGQKQGVISHEFLHSLGLPDLYRYNSSDTGMPVGPWDIMAQTSPYLQYPLSYLRAKQGWVTGGSITASGTYTLTAADVLGGTKVFEIRTPLSDTETIAVEYRRKNSTMNAFESKLPSSGLLMYRIDSKVSSGSNSEGKNYIYVYRPNVTEAETARDMAANPYLSSAQTNAVFMAAIDKSLGETSYGSNDLNASFQDNTLYYSDGSNSGVKISNVVISDDTTTMTFDVTFPDYAQADIWDKTGDTVQGSESTAISLCQDEATGTLYEAYTVDVNGQDQLKVCTYNGSVWTQLGGNIADAYGQKIVFCNGELYLSYIKSSNGLPVYMKYNASAGWTTLRTGSVAYPEAMSFLVDGTGIYEMHAEPAGSGNNTSRLVISNVKTGAVINNTKTLGNFGNASFAKIGNEFYVLYSDFFGTNGKSSTIIESYNTSKKTWSVVRKYDLGATNIHSIMENNGKLYALSAYSGTHPTVSVYDGAKWIDTTVTNATQYYQMNMAIVQGEVYITYSETPSNKVKVLQKVQDTFVEIAPNLADGVGDHDFIAAGNTLYVGTVGLNTGFVSIRKKTLETKQYPLTLTPPANYNDATIYIDGVAYPTQQSGGSYSTTVSNINAEVATMYRYDEKGTARGMYVWRIKYVDGAYTATALPGLEDLLGYHGFSIRITDPAGIRFKSSISIATREALQTTGIDGYKLDEYGSMYIISSNMDKYPFVKLGRKSTVGRSYWIENGQTTDKVFETIENRYRFASVMTGAPESAFGTDLTFRAYIVLHNGNDKIIIYGPQYTRSIYAVAKALDGRNDFTPGSSGDLYIKHIIDVVER